MKVLSVYWYLECDFLSSWSDGESELDDSSMVTETELPDKHSDLPAGMFTPTTLPSIAKGGSINNNNNTGKDKQPMRKCILANNHRVLNV